MKKTWIILLAAVLLLAALWLLVTGFQVNTSVFIWDYAVSSDGSEMTLTVQLGSSMGYVRDYRDVGSETVHLLKFYSAWGGLNSRLGAKQRYVLALRPQDTEIAVYGSSGPVLKKDAATGQWSLVSR